MSAYLIVSTRVVQQHGWGPYQSQVGSCFDRHGGKYLVKRSIPDVVEGVFPQDRLTMFEFPSLDVIHALWDSEEYRGIRKLREGLGELNVWAVAGTEDVA
jgi:uncharacterized protein (DUF1330 family)